MTRPPGAAPMMRYDSTCLHEGDDVAVMVVAGIQGQSCRVLQPGGDILSVELSADVPFGHKVALRRLEAGQVVKKYGQPIGVAFKDIGAGEHVHTHNLEGLKSGLRGVTNG